MATGSSVETDTGHEGLQQDHDVQGTNLTHPRDLSTSHRMNSSTFEVVTVQLRTRNSTFVRRSSLVNILSDLGDLEGGRPYNRLTNSFLCLFPFPVFKQFVMVLTVVVGSSGSGMCFCYARGKVVDVPWPRHVKL